MQRKQNFRLKDFIYRGVKFIYFVALFSQSNLPIFLLKIKHNFISTPALFSPRHVHVTQPDSGTREATLQTWRTNHGSCSFLRFTHWIIPTALAPCLARARGTRWPVLAKAAAILGTRDTWDIIVTRDTCDMITCCVTLLLRVQVPPKHDHWLQDLTEEGVEGSWKRVFYVLHEWKRK